VRSNPSKLLLDPYTTAIDGQVRWDELRVPS
jgi:pullulanase/glycogen debranching enzyme